MIGLGILVISSLFCTFNVFGTFFFFALWRSLRAEQFFLVIKFFVVFLVICQHILFFCCTAAAAAAAFKLLERMVSPIPIFIFIFPHFSFTLFCLSLAIDGSVSGFFWCFFPLFTFSLFVLEERRNHFLREREGGKCHRKIFFFFSLLAAAAAAAEDDTLIELCVESVGTSARPFLPLSISLNFFPLSFHFFVLLRSTAISNNIFGAFCFFFCQQTVAGHFFRRWQ